MYCSISLFFLSLTLLVGIQIGNRSAHAQSPWSPITIGLPSDGLVVLEDGTTIHAYASGGQLHTEFLGNLFGTTNQQPSTWGNLKTRYTKK